MAVSNLQRASNVSLNPTVLKPVDEQNGQKVYHVTGQYPHRSVTAAAENILCQRHRTIINRVRRGIQHSVSGSQ